MFSAFNCNQTCTSTDAMNFAPANTSASHSNAVVSVIDTAIIAVSIFVIRLIDALISVIIPIKNNFKSKSQTCRSAI